MLSELWFTGWRLGSPGHRPFWASASISVPGAPASSLATGSQPPVRKPGVEICAPVWVALALLCTCQPWAPRFDTLLAPVSATAEDPAPPAVTCLAGPACVACVACVACEDCVPLAAPRACAPVPSQARAMTEATAVAPRAQ